MPFQCAAALVMDGYLCVWVWCVYACVAVAASEGGCAGVVGHGAVEVGCWDCGVEVGMVG